MPPDRSGVGTAAGRVPRCHDSHPWQRSRLPAPPTDPSAPSGFLQPGNPPANTKDFDLRGARRPTRLAGCTSTGEQQTVANLEKALACTGPFAKWPARCTRLADPAPNRRS
jgi:hypothetical protein